MGDILAARIVSSLRKTFLGDAGENPDVFPSGVTLNLGSPLVVRCPHAWILLFEMRSAKKTHFVTTDMTPGELTRTFALAGRKVFSRCLREPFTLAAGTEQKLAELVEIFTSLGVLFSVFPVPGSVARVDESMGDLLQVLKPLLNQARDKLAELNEGLIDECGGSGDRFRIWKKLDPTAFLAEDKDALKRATTKAEAPLEGGRRAVFAPSEKRTRSSSSTADPKKVCSICGQDFSGSWSKHHRTSAGCKAKKKDGAK